VTITVVNTFTWQNTPNRFDVNDDGTVSAIDVLLIINQLNRVGPHTLSSPGDAPPPPYVDVTGDGSITAQDALQVINFLNRPAGGEGESSTLESEQLVQDSYGSESVGSFTTLVVTVANDNRTVFGDDADSITGDSNEEPNIHDDFFASLNNGRNTEVMQPASGVSNDDADDEWHRSEFERSVDELFAKAIDGV
jgi:hypothetical protein